MLDFNVQMLGKLADWLLSEPIVYFVGMVLMCFVVGVVLNLYVLAAFETLRSSRNTDIVKKNNERK